MKKYTDSQSQKMAISSTVLGNLKLPVTRQQSWKLSVKFKTPWLQPCKIVLAFTFMAVTK